MTNKYNVVVWGFMLHASNESYLTLRYQPIEFVSPYAPRNNEMVHLEVGFGERERKRSLKACIIFLAATLWSDCHMAYIVATPPPHGPVYEFGQHHLKSSQAI